MTDLFQIESAAAEVIRIGVSSLAKVYDHEPKQLAKLPAATLYFDGFEQQDQASRSKLMTWRWMLRIYSPLREADKAQQEIKALILDVLKALRANPTLNGSCLFHAITRGEIFVAVEQNNPHIIAELFLEATTKDEY